jgi:hypothetical protein
MEIFMRKSGSENIRSRPGRNTFIVFYLAKLAASPGAHLYDRTGRARGPLRAAGCLGLIGPRASVLGLRQPSVAFSSLVLRWKSGRGLPQSKTSRSGGPGFQKLRRCFKDTARSPRSIGKFEMPAISLARLNHFAKIHAWPA